MKKWITVFLILACLTALLPAPARAETNKEVLFDEGIDWLFPFCEFFGEGTLPKEHLRHMIGLASYSNSGIFSQYLAQTALVDEDAEIMRIKVSGDVPAAELEAHLGEHFTDKQAIVDFLRSNDPIFDVCTYADGVYHIELKTLGGTDMYGHLPYYLGYKELGANLYEVYHFQLDCDYFWKKDYTFPAEDEGKEYILIWYDEGISHAKIEDKAIKSVISIENGTYAFRSYEEIDRAAIPTDLENEGWKDSFTMARFWGRNVILSIDAKDYPDGYWVSISHRDNYDNIAADKQLPKDTVIYNCFHFTIENSANESLSADNFSAPVTATLTVPEECTDPVVYHIVNNGKTVKEISGRMEGGEYVCTVSPDCVYVLAQRSAVEPEPTTPPSTEPEPTEPMPSASAPSESDTPSPAPSEPEAPTPEIPEEKPHDKTESAPDLTWVWIAAGAAAAAVIAAVVLILIRKKK